MSERGVCICPSCGCQFSDDQKAKYERMATRREWRKRPLYRFRVWRLSRRVDRLRGTPPKNQEQAR